MSSNRRSHPKQKLSPLPKVPHLNLPIRPYDRTLEENGRIAKEHYDAQMKKKKPEPRPKYTEKQINYAKYLLTLPSQYDLHHKPGDYLRTLQKEGKKSRSSRSASGSKSSKSARMKRSDVPQLRQRAKQSIPPLKVLSENVPSLVQQQSLEEAKKWAAEWIMSVEDIMVSQDELFPKAVVAPKPKFVMGEPLVSKERLQELPTHMRHLHAWYPNDAKNGRIMIVANVPREYYSRPEEIHFEFEELFQMYNCEALDKSPMSCCFLQVVQFIVYIHVVQLFQLFSSLHVIILTISFCTLLCRMKFLVYKSRNILNVGFIDPDKVHIKMLTDNPEEMEENLLRFLTDQNFCDHILFPYNFR
jgi:hypothetical protein